VQTGSPEGPLTVKFAGAASEALAEAGETEPLAQERDTVTLAALLGTKSLFTAKSALISILMMVQLAVPPCEMARLAHPVWLTL
jgi:hypothetical protein